MVMSERSINLTIQAYTWLAVNKFSVHVLLYGTGNCPSWKERQRMTVENISRERRKNEAGPECRTRGLITRRTRSDWASGSGLHCKYMCKFIITQVSWHINPWMPTEPIYDYTFRTAIALMISVLLYYVRKISVQRKQCKPWTNVALYGLWFEYT